jgi:hypothetical protein
LLHEPATVSRQPSRGNINDANGGNLE